MKVTVCELPDNADSLISAWAGLVDHAGSEHSQLLLLPEMPFFPWIAATNQVDPETWQQASQAHERWRERFTELAPAVVMGSQPVVHEETRLNEGFVWGTDPGYTPAHHKYYLPDEEGFWEASWYQRGSGNFQPASAAGAQVGFAICSEMWFTEHARSYARQGIHLLACPRATGRASVGRWIAGGRAAAVMSGAYCISSNRSGHGSGIDWGGNGWMIDPNGEVLGLTSAERPFLTLELDLAVADRAKQTYPRNVQE